MNVEQAEETPQKAVLALEADEDSDQDDFTSPGKALITRTDTEIRPVLTFNIVSMVDRKNGSQTHLAGLTVQVWTS